MSRSPVLGVVAARGGSERLPRKNLLPILGRPVLDWTLDAARESRLVDRWVVSTDDPAISAAARRRGFEVIPRPRSLARATSAIDDALRHVVRVLRARDRYVPDAVVLLQGNVPVRPGRQVDGVVAQLLGDPRATAVATACRARERPEWMKRIADPRTMEVRPWMRGVRGYRHQDFPALYLLNGAVEAVRTGILMGRSRSPVPHAWLGPRLCLRIESPLDSVEIDEAADLDLARAVLARRIRRRRRTAPGAPGARTPPRRPGRARRRTARSPSRPDGGRTPR